MSSEIRFFRYSGDVLQLFNLLDGLEEIVAGTAPSPYRAAVAAATVVCVLPFAPPHGQRYKHVQFLQTNNVVEGVVAADRDFGFDAIYVRGPQLCDRLLARAPCLGDRLICGMWGLDLDAVDYVDLARRLLARCRALAFLSPLHRDRFADRLRQMGAARADIARVSVVTPSAVPLDPSLPPLERPDTPHLVYAGVVRPGYGVETVAEALRRIRRRRPSVQFHILRTTWSPSRGPWARRMRRIMYRQPGVVLGGPLDPASARRYMLRCGVGTSVDSFTDLRVYSLTTKIMDYMVHGLPVLCPPVPANRFMLGEDYPLFVATPRDVAEAYEALEDRATWRQVSRDVVQRGRRFTHHAVADALLSLVLGRSAAG